MTNSDFTVKTVSLTDKQYAQIIYTTHFLKGLCALVEESSLDITADSITPLIVNAVLDLERLLDVNV